MIEHSFHLVLISVEIFIPAAGSLKSKRRVVKSLKDRIANRFNASVAEIGFQDTWQRSILAVAMLSNDKAYLEKQTSKLRELFDSEYEAEIAAFQVEWI